MMTVKMTMTAVPPILENPPVELYYSLKTTLGLICTFVNLAKEDLTIIGASDPFQNWQNKYTVPVDVLLDGVYKSNPNEGPYCYTTTFNDKLRTPFVKIAMKDRTKVEKVRVLVRDNYFRYQWDINWGQVFNRNKEGSSLPE